MRKRLIDPFPDLHARAAKEVKEDFDLPAAPQATYAWDQINDSDWWPEPRYGGAPLP